MYDISTFYSCFNKNSAFNFSFKTRFAFNGEMNGLEIY